MCWALILLALLVTGITVFHVRPYPTTIRHVCRRYRTRDDDDDGTTGFEGFTLPGNAVQETVERIRQSKAAATASVQGASVRYI